MPERGFTIFELLVCLGLMALLGVLGAPSIALMTGQMSAADDARRFALALVAARDEAIRLRTEVRVTPTSDGFSVDINADQSIEEEVPFASASFCPESSVAAVTFNGLGLARGITGTTTYILQRNGAQAVVRINQNGTVSL